EWAGIERALLVDAYAAFAPERATLIGEDGLHPTPAGYTRLAELFRDAIQANFELPPPAAPAPAGLHGLLQGPGRVTPMPPGIGIGPTPLARGRAWRD